MCPFFGDLAVLNTVETESTAPDFFSSGAGETGRVVAEPEMSAELQGEEIPVTGQASDINVEYLRVVMHINNMLPAGL